MIEHRFGYRNRLYIYYSYWYDRKCLENARVWSRDVYIRHVTWLNIEHRIRSVSWLTATSSADNNSLLERTIGDVDEERGSWSRRCDGGIGVSRDWDLPPEGGAAETRDSLSWLISRITGAIFNELSDDCVDDVTWYISSIRHGTVKEFKL